MKANVLGTVYKIKVDKISKNKILSENKWAGYIDYRKKHIIIADYEDKKEFPGFTKIDVEANHKETLRHELIHAFLNESGLSGNTVSANAWATNEEMIDWFAIQSPKILKLFKELGCEE